MAKTSFPRSRILIAFLIVLGGVYLALTPWIRRLNAETERINREEEGRRTKMAQGAAVSSRLEEARATAARAPSDPRAHLSLATLCGDLGKLDEAAKEAEAAVRLLPGDPKAMLLLAQIYQRDHRYDPAIRTYRGILSMHPGHAQATAGISLIYLSFGWTSDARKLLQPAISASPDDLRLRVALALVCVQHSDYKEAEQLLQLVRRRAPNEAGLWSPLVDFYNKTRRYPEAIKAAQDALALMPNDLRLLSGLAEAYHENGDIPSAELTCRNILALDPENIFAHHRLALCAKATKNPGEAAKHLEIVARLDPGFEKTRLLLGQLYLQQNRVHEGKKLLREYSEQAAISQKHTRVGLIVSMNPGNADAHLNMARLYKEEQNLPRMIVELNRTLELAPGNKEARRLMDEAQRSPGGRK
jgi:tetratricopeptide (TPR) repeat protein